MTILERKQEADNLRKTVNTLIKKLSLFWDFLLPHLPALGIFLFAVLLTSYPILNRISSAYLGGGGDTPYYIWLGWWRKYSFLNGLDFHKLSLSQYPFGTDQVFRTYPGTYISLAIIGWLTDEVAAINLLAMMAQMLSCLFTYIIGIRLTNDRVSSIIGALVFSYSPYLIAEGDHIDLRQQWVIPMALFLLLRLRDQQTLKASVLTGGGFALAFYFHAYYGFFLVISAVTFGLVDLVFLLREHGRGGILLWRRYSLFALAGVVSIILYSPELIGILQELMGGSEHLLRPHSALTVDQNWIFVLSTRPWYFVTPSTKHPLLGAWAVDILQNTGWQTGLNTLPASLVTQYPTLDTTWLWWNMGSNSDFLGYTNLLLLVYLLVRMRFIRGWDDSMRFARAFFLILLVVAILFSLPPFYPYGVHIARWFPDLAEAYIFTPSYIIAALAPPLRGVYRLAAVMMLALGMIVTLSIYDLRRWLSPSWKSTLIIIVVVMGILFDYWHIPEVQSFPRKEAFEWWAQQSPDTVMVTYPLSYRPFLAAQAYHTHPTVDSLAYDAGLSLDNIGYIQSYALADYWTEQTLQKLAALTVSNLYVEAPLPEAPPMGLMPILETESGWVYEINAEPANLIVLATPHDGLWMSDTDWQWEAAEFLVYIWNPLNHSAVVDISLTVEEVHGNSGVWRLMRVLTPYPPSLIINGIRVQNPYAEPHYPPDPLPALPVRDNLMIDDVQIVRGETMLVFEWVGNDRPTPIIGFDISLEDPLH